MLNEKRRLICVGISFLILLAFSYFENVIFFKSLNILFQNQILAFFMIFIHNVIVISLILLGITFYVSLVKLNFFKGQKYEYVILEHPRTFAIIFAVMILFISLLRGSTLILGETNVEVLPKILLISTPIGIIEGYGIYLTIRKTLSRTITIKDLACIYGIFAIAAVVEIGFINLLM